MKWTEFNTTLKKDKKKDKDKDKVSLKYVSDEMASIFKESTVKIDYEKVPLQG